VLARFLGGAEPAAAPEPSALDALVDDARMRIFREDYPEIVDQLVELFVESTPPLLVELREAAAGADGDGVCRAAHKLKGSCQNVGAGFMAKLAQAIEVSHSASELELARLEHIFGDTRDALRAALLEA